MSCCQDEHCAIREDWRCILEWERGLIVCQRGNSPPANWRDVVKEEGVSAIPRRCYVDLMTPAELAIRQAIIAVEQVGAHPLLTDAVVLLQQAKEKVADYIDRKPEGETA